MAKVIIFVTKCDLQDTAGSLQLCAGQIAGLEAAIHARKTCFQEDVTEAVLLVNPSNECFQHSIGKLPFTTLDTYVHL